MSNEGLIGKLESELIQAKDTISLLESEIEKYQVAPTLNLKSDMWGNDNRITCPKPDNLTSMTVPAVKATNAYLRSVCKSYIYQFVTSTEPMTFYCWFLLQNQDGSVPWSNCISCSGQASTVYNQFEDGWSYLFQTMEQTQVAIVLGKSNGHSAFCVRPLSVNRVTATATAPIDWSSQRTKNVSFAAPAVFTGTGSFELVNAGLSSKFLRTVDSNNTHHFYEYVVELFTYPISTTTENYIEESDWWW